MDPISSFVATSIVAGVIGNRSDYSISKLAQSVAERFDRITPPQNHDLLKAYWKAYLQACHLLCEAVIKQRADGQTVRERLAKFAHPDGEQTWLKRTIQRIETDLANSDAIITRNLHSQEERFELLLLPQSARSQDLVQQMRTRLENNLFTYFALSGEPIPKLVKEMAINGWHLEATSAVQGGHTNWFALVCAFFINEIKINSRVKSILDSQILAELSIDGVQVETSSFDAALAAQGGAILERIESLKLLLAENHAFASQAYASLQNTVERLSALPHLSEQLDELLRLAKRRQIAEQYMGREIAGRVEARRKELSVPIYGREQELLSLDNMLVEQSCGHILILGAAGLGKSSLIANWLDSRQETGYFFAYHFFTQETSRSEDALLNLVRQLFVYYELEQEPLPLPHQVRGTLFGLITDRGGRANEPLVLVIDALDEAASDFDLPLPNPLPPHVYCIASARAKGGDGSELLPQSWPFAQQAKILWLKPITGEAIKEWFHDSEPLLANVLATRPDLHQRIVEISGGLSLFLRYLIEDFSHAARQGEDLALKLEAAPKGFTDYVKREFERLARSERLRRDNRLQEMFALLSVAQGELEADDLLSLCGFGIWDLADIPHEVTRWLRITSLNEGRQSYSFAHPLISREFRSILGREARQAETKLLTYCTDWEQNNSRYALIYYPHHLVAAGRREDLLTLLIDTREWIQRKYQVFQSHILIRSDLKLARSLFSDPGTETELSYLTKLVVLECTLTTQDRHYSDKDLEILVRLGSCNEALNAARSRPDALSKVKSYLQISKCAREHNIEESISLDNAAHELLSINDTVPVEALGEVVSLLRLRGQEELATSLEDHALAFIQRFHDTEKKLSMGMHLLSCMSSDALSRFFQEVTTWTRPSQRRIGFSLAQNLMRVGQQAEANSCLNWYENEEDRLYFMGCIAVAFAQSGNLEEAKLAIHALKLPADTTAAFAIFSSHAYALAKYGVADLLDRLLALPDGNPAQWAYFAWSFLVRAYLLLGRADEAMEFAFSLPAGKERTYLFAEIIELFSSRPDHQQRIVLEIFQAAPIIPSDAARTKLMQIGLRFGARHGLVYPPEIHHALRRVPFSATVCAETAARLYRQGEATKADEYLVTQAAKNESSEIYRETARILLTDGYAEEAARLFNAQFSSLSHERELRQLLSSPAMYAIVATLFQSGYIAQARVMLPHLQKALDDYIAALHLTPQQRENQYYLVEQRLVPYIAMLCILGEAGEASERIALLRISDRRAWLHCRLANYWLENKNVVQAWEQWEQAAKETIGDVSTLHECVRVGVVLLKCLPLAQFTAAQEHALKRIAEIAIVVAQNICSVRAASLSSVRALLVNVAIELNRRSELETADILFSEVLLQAALDRPETLEMLDIFIAHCTHTGATEEAAALREIQTYFRAQNDTSQTPAPAPSEFETRKQLCEEGKPVSALLFLLDTPVEQALTELCVFQNGFNQSYSPGLAGRLIWEGIAIAAEYNPVWNDIWRLLSSESVVIDPSSIIASEWAQEHSFVLPPEYVPGRAFRAACFSLQGYAEWHAGHWHQALTAYETAAKLSQDTSALYSCLFLYQLSDNWEKATGTAEQIIARDADEWHLLPLIAMSRGDWDVAHAEYSQREQENLLENSGSLYWLGITILTQRDFSTALDAFERALVGTTDYELAITSFWKAIASEENLSGDFPPLEKLNRDQILLWMLITCYSNAATEAHALMTQVLTRNPYPYRVVIARIYLKVLQIIFPQNSTIESTLSLLDQHRNQQFISTEGEVPNVIQPLSGSM